MSRPNMNAVTMETRCGSFRHQKAMTSSNRSGAGCHRRQGSSEISQVRTMVNHMNRPLEGRLNGDASIGSSELSEDAVRRVAGARVLLSILRNMAQPLLVEILRRHIHQQYQK